MAKFTIVAIIALIIYQFGRTKSSYFEHQKLENNGIFFEKLGETSFYAKNLNILTTLNIPNTRKLTDTLLDCNAHLQVLCSEILEKNPSDLCKSFKRELKWHIGQIMKQDNKISEMYGRRQKRGLLDIGGRISKFVFGTMDSEDSDTIYKNLQTLEDGQTKILNLETQHIAVLQSNFNALSKPIIELQNETYEIQNKLNELIQKSNDQHEFSERKEKLNQQVTELMSIILIQCLHISRIQEEATEIISTLENNKLHPLVTSYTKIIDVIKTHEIDTNAKMTQHEILRQIIKTAHTEIDNQIIVKISLPIMEKDEYTLYKPYLTPFPKMGKYQTYETDTDYLAVNKEKTRTIELHTKDVERGKKLTNHLDENFILCQHSQPIILNPTTHCLPTLFVNPLKAEEICDTILTHPTNTITKLENTNSWLYSLNGPTEMIIECNGKTDKIEIQKVGLLTFLTACRVTTRDFTMIVAGNPTKLELDQTPILPDSDETDIKFDNAPYQERSKLTKIKLIDGKIHNRDFLQESKKINDLKNTANKIQLKHQQTNSEYIKITIISITATLTAILIITITYKRCTRKKNTTVVITEKTTPQRRSKRIATPRRKRNDDEEGIKVI